MYETGQGVPQDYGKARALYETAAAGGDSEAMHSIGLLYENGRGVTQDYAKAREWFEKAFAAGNPAAPTSIGFLYEMGYGVSRDYQKGQGMVRKRRCRRQRIRNARPWPYV
jgi:hypothetical protein